MTPPTLSILIPTCDGSNMLRESVASMLAQAYTDYEIIIVNSCLTDDTEAVVVAFGDNRVEYHENVRNIGVVYNYSKVLPMAISKYIYLFSDDDVVLASN